MDAPILKTWVGGRAEATPVLLGPAVDPSTGEPYAESRQSSVEQVDRAVDAAAEAHARGDWMRLGPEGRAAALIEIADLVDAQTDTIGVVDARASGVPIVTMSLIASSLGGAFRAAAELAVSRGDTRRLPAERTVLLRSVPWGPTAILLPWNVPAGTMAKKTALALAAGASVVAKPSPLAPWGPQLLAEAISAVVPAGVFSLVHGGGDVGRRLVSDPRIAAVAMTGSTATGRSIAALASPRFARLQLELGSSNPAIVLEDADLDDACARIAAGALKLSGQWCEAPERIFVPRRLHDEVVERLVTEFGRPVIGPAVDPATEVGPVVSASRKAELETAISGLAAEGARVHAAQSVPEEGSFLPPTVIAVERPPSGAELFGPVVQVRGYDSVDEAVIEANLAQVGLGGYVFGTDEGHAFEIGSRLVAGEVKVNGTSVLDMSAESKQSFFGDAGVGGHGDADVFEFFRGTQVIGVDDPGAPL